MILMIDNYDSFTYNVVRYLNELGAEVEVVRNDEWSPAQIEAFAPRAIVLSPGPGKPDDAGVSLRVVERFAGRIPILGVCLGHQTIGQALGGRVVPAKTLMHGKTSQVFHRGQGVFRGLPNPFTATRYHSLVVARDAWPGELELTAWTRTPEGEIDEVMGLRHRHFPLEGVQFHPESVLSEGGHRLLENFINNELGDEL